MGDLYIVTQNKLHFVRIDPSTMYSLSIRHGIDQEWDLMYVTSPEEKPLLVASYNKEDVAREVLGMLGRELVGVHNTGHSTIMELCNEEEIISSGMYVKQWVY